PYAPHPYTHAFPTRRSSDLFFNTHMVSFKGNPCFSAKVPVDLKSPYINISEVEIFRLWKTLMQKFQKFSSYRIMITAQIDHQARSEEHTSELQSRFDLVCRL